MKSKYAVSLSEAERARLRTLVGCGAAPARQLAHARILLKADQGDGGPGWHDAAIAGALEVCTRTVARVRQQYVTEGMEAALQRRMPAREYARALDGAAEARLIALACGTPRAGREGWRQLPSRELHNRSAARRARGVESAPAGRRAGPPGGCGGCLARDGAADLKANDLKPWLRTQWCIPPAGDADFAWHMEDVLDVYTRPYDPRRPQVCLDETSRQLLGEVAAPLPLAPGRPVREDAEYVRAGVANVFLACEPLRGWRHVAVSERRTRADFAHCIKELVDVHYPAAERIVLVLDNLNIHSPASLYETFAPAEAKRLAEKLEIHYTPRHGSWLNMAEIELSILQRQCLDRRLGGRAAMERETAAWETARNAAGQRIDWRFTTADARIKLKRLYPTVHE